MLSAASIALRHRTIVAFNGNRRSTARGLACLICMSAAGCASPPAALWPASLADLVARQRAADPTVCDRPTDATVTGGDEIPPPATPTHEPPEVTAAFDRLRAARDQMPAPTAAPATATPVSYATPHQESALPHAGSVGGSDGERDSAVDMRGNAAGGDDTVAEENRVQSTSGTWSPDATISGPGWLTEPTLWR